jgi:hypothetical protein
MLIIISTNSTRVKNPQIESITCNTSSRATSGVHSMGSSSSSFTHDSFPIWSAVRYSRRAHPPPPHAARGDKPRERCPCDDNSSRCIIIICSVTNTVRSLRHFPQQHYTLPHAIRGLNRARVAFGTQTAAYPLRVPRKNDSHSSHNSLISP